MLWQPTRGILQPDQHWRRPQTASGGAFTPADIPGLLGWYKADAGAYVDAGSTLATNGQTVQQWNDQSGNNNHLTNATATDRPVYTTAQLNGLPGIVHTPILNKWMGVAISLGGTTASVFCVMKTAASVGDDRVITFRGPTGEDYDTVANCIFWYSSASNALTAYRNGTKSSATVSASTNYQLGCIYDGTNNTVYLNGTAQTSVGSTGTFASTGTLYVGGSPGNTHFEGSFYEIVFTNTAISSGDQTSLASYFTTRWGV